MLSSGAARAAELATPKVVNKIDAVTPTNQQLPSVKVSQCLLPTVETRLFASSNGGTNEARNQLALQRLACAGLKVQNPAIVSRQYLRFAGTDSQRASDLQNIATGAIAAPL